MRGLSQDLFRATVADAGVFSGLGESRWPELAERASQEGVAGMLYQRCLSFGIRLPKDQYLAMGACYRRTAAENFLALRELAEILADMESAGVDILLMPGACLLPMYPDIGCRPMDDIDLLVHAGSAQAAREVLLSRGYECPPRHSDLFEGKYTVVDLHTDLLNSGRIRARKRSGWLDAKEVWGDCREAVVDGVSVQAMGMEDALLYTAVHGMKHSFSRLNWLLDLHFIMGADLDWDLVQQKAGRYRLSRALAYGLNCLAQLQDRKMPVRAVEHLRSFRLGRVERWLLMKMCADRPYCDWGEVLRVFNCGGRIKGAAFLLEFFFPRPAVLLQVFPALPRALFPLAYGLRLGQLCLRGGAQFIGGVRRHRR